MEEVNILEEIYQFVLKKYQAKEKMLELMKKQKKMGIINDEFYRCLVLLKKGRNNLIKINSIKLLYNITFEDFIFDKYILEAIASNEEEIKISNLFINKDRIAFGDESPYYQLFLTNDKLLSVKYHYGKIYKKSIAPNVLTSFVTLEHTLNNSSYMGNLGYTLKKQEGLVLYSGGMFASKNQFILYKKDENLKALITDKRLETVSFLKSPLEGLINLENKAYVLELIKAKLISEYSDINLKSKVLLPVQTKKM